MRRSGMRARIRIISALCLMTSIVMWSMYTASDADARGKITYPYTTDLLQAVSCTTPTFCLAMGTTVGDHSLGEEWDGSQWVVVHTDRRVDMQSVSCITSSSCVAAGFSVNPAYGVATIEDWKGTRWGLAPLHPAIRPGLTGVSCAADGFCAALGLDIGDKHGFAVGATRRQPNSKWSYASVPDPSTDIGFSDLSCASSSSCMALGMQEDTYPSDTVIGQWNGSAWSSAPNSIPGDLTAISCSSTSQCKAVGLTWQGDTATTALAESWNGTSWTIDDIVPSSGGFTAVSCSRPTSCMAVGFAAPQGSCVVFPNPCPPQAEQWNGSSWVSTTPETPPGSTFSALSGVSCTGPSDCFAVGQYSTSTLHLNALTLVEHWNGVAWSIVPSPSPYYRFTVRS